MDDSYRVLLTGFGPFSTFLDNPSWLAVEPLRNKLITVDAKTIHITALQIPVVYTAILDIIPGLHTCPPVLPSPECHLSPPERGYDFVFHVGVGRCGPLCLEKIGHKSGYNLEDNDGKYALEIPAFNPDLGGLKDHPRWEKDSGGGDVVHQPTRGFGKGYEAFAEELSTSLDLQSLMCSMKLSRIEQVRISNDAGHYLCDFIYYCSLAEAIRNTKGDSAPTQVLFLHCPPINDPLSTEEVTEAIKQIIMWVCAQK